MRYQETLFDSVTSAGIRDRAYHNRRARVKKLAEHRWKGFTRSEQAEWEEKAKVGQHALGSPLDSLLADYFAAVLSYEQPQKAMRSVKKLVTSIRGCTGPDTAEMEDLAEVEDEEAVDSPMEESSQADRSSSHAAAPVSFEESEKVCG